jgi:hypothetical protein
VDPVFHDGDELFVRQLTIAVFVEHQEDGVHDVLAQRLTGANFHGSVELLCKGTIRLEQTLDYHILMINMSEISLFSCADLFGRS